MTSQEIQDASVKFALHESPKGPTSPDVSSEQRRCQYQLKEEKEAPHEPAPAVPAGSRDHPAAEKLEDPGACLHMCTNCLTIKRGKGKSLTSKLVYPMK